MIDPGSPSPTPTPTPSPVDLEVERLVRAGLDREAERIDPRPLFARIMLDSGGPAVASSGIRRRRPRALLRWAGAASAAGLVVAGLVFSRQERAAYARGEAVVIEARRAHRMPIDRCYLVEVRRESSLAAELAPNVPQVRQTRLWTRGDRFWVESARPDQRWAWGRDQSNRFWIAFGPRTGVRFEADEVPDWLNLYCDLHSLNVERLLGEVLGKFDLAREAGPDGSTIRIRANARELALPPRAPGIASAELEIDAETRVIRRMVVRRSWDGQPFATVTCTLAETDARDPADYRIEGHLTDPSETYTRDHEPQRRKELMARWFGPRAGRRAVDATPTDRP